MKTLGPIKHIPVDLGLDLPKAPAGRIRLSYEMDHGTSADGDWEIEKLTAEFAIGAGFESFIRIEFEGPMIFRVLDETMLSCATDSARWVGDLSSFAREVVDDDFAEMHSHFLEIVDGAKHYQFVTGVACLDVIAPTCPNASLHKSKD